MPSLKRALHQILVQRLVLAGLAQPPFVQASMGDGADCSKLDAPAWKPGREKQERQGTSAAVNGCDAEPHDDLQSLLDILGKQSCNLQKLQEKGEAARIGKLRREEARIRGSHSSGASWKRPSSYAREFSKTGTLPVKYLNPFEQQASTRPSRSYERTPDPEKGPFWDVSTYPQIFGEPPVLHNQAPLINSARALLGSKSPRAEPALKPWLPTYSSPRTLDNLKLVDERLSTAWA